jgi:DNA transformation protein
VKVAPELLAWLQDLFGALGPVRARPMFGGAGVYVGDLMIGLLDRDETLYLRVDEETQPTFEAAGSSPFTYFRRQAEEFPLPYWRAPEEALDGPDAAEPWGRLAMSAALRKAARPRKSRSRG